MELQTLRFLLDLRWATCRFAVPSTRVRTRQPHVKDNSQTLANKIVFDKEKCLPAEKGVFIISFGQVRHTRRIQGITTHWQTPTCVTILYAALF